VRFNVGAGLLYAVWLVGAGLLVFSGRGLGDDATALLLDLPVIVPLVLIGGLLLVSKIARRLRI
jgi:hypothetical protein